MRSLVRAAGCMCATGADHGAYALKVHFWLRDALVSIYARAMTPQIRACCTVELHGGLHFGHKLNASALHALACIVAHCSGVSKTREASAKTGRAPPARRGRLDAKAAPPAKGRSRTPSRHPI